MGNVGLVIKRHNCREKPGVLEHVRDHTDLAAHGTAKDGMKKGSIGFDRAAEDIGNVIALEHLNVLVPDQRLATVFYIAGLGLTRDPYLMTTVTNMWANIGRSQFRSENAGTGVDRRFQQAFVCGCTWALDRSTRISDDFADAKARGMADSMAQFVAGEHQRYSYKSSPRLTTLKALTAPGWQIASRNATRHTCGSLSR